MVPTNLLADLPATLSAELVELLVRTANVRIERIVSHGHASPKDFWYDQDEHEWVLLVQGKAKLRFETEVIELRAGDYINIPAHQRHRVDWTDPTQPTVWLAIYYA